MCVIGPDDNQVWRDLEALRLHLGTCWYMLHSKSSYSIGLKRQIVPHTSGQSVKTKCCGQYSPVPIPYKPKPKSSNTTKLPSQLMQDHANLSQDHKQVEPLHFWLGISGRLAKHSDSMQSQQQQQKQPLQALRRPLWQGCTCGLDVQASWLDVDALGEYANTRGSYGDCARGIANSCESKLDRRNCSRSSPQHLCQCICWHPQQHVSCCGDQMQCI